MNLLMIPTSLGQEGMVKADKGYRGSFALLSRSKGKVVSLMT